MKIKKNVELSNLTTIKTGGKADYLIEIQSKNDLKDSFDFIKKNNLNFICLGGGSNLIINDNGFSGVVLKMENKNLFFRENICEAESGIKIFDLIMKAKEKNLGGLEWSFSVPATLGGAIRNNLGAFSLSISDLISEVTCFDINTQSFKIFNKKQCFFGYRETFFSKNPNFIIFSAKLSLTPMPQNEIEKKLTEFLNQRLKKQPLEYPSAGSFFKNPTISKIKKSDLEKLIDDFIASAKTTNPKDQSELKKEILKRGQLPAAYFIERIGLKGKTIGGAMVSKKHANFIINFNKAKTEDIIILSSIIKEKVRNKFGIQLYEEVQYVGF